MTLEEFDKQVENIKSTFYKDIDNLKTIYTDINLRTFVEFSNAVYDTFFKTTPILFDAYHSFVSNKQNGTLINDDKKLEHGDIRKKFKLYCDNITNEALLKIDNQDI